MNTLTANILTDVFMTISLIAHHFNCLIREEIKMHDVIVGILIDSVAFELTNETPEEKAYMIFRAKVIHQQQHQWLSDEFPCDRKSFDHVWFPKIKQSKLYNTRNN